MVLAAYPLHVFIKAQHVGWPRALPTWALVLVAPVDETVWIETPIKTLDPQDPLLAELVDRAQAGQLTPSQWRIFFSRLHASNPSSLDVLVAPEVWARDTPVVVGIAPSQLIRSITWKKFSVCCRLRIEGTDAPWLIASGNSNLTSPVDHLGFPGDRTRGRIEVELCLFEHLGPAAFPGMSRPVDPDRPIRVWRHTFGDFAIRHRADQVLSPVDNDQVRGLLQTLDPHVLLHSGQLQLIWQKASFLDDQDITFGVDVEVLRDRVVVAEGSLRLDRRERAFVERMGTLLTWTQGPVALDEDASWTLVLRGSATESLGAPLRLGDLFLSDRKPLPTTYWSGELEIVPVMPWNASDR